MDRPFYGDSEHVSQNAHVNTTRCAMMCDMQFPFPKIL